MLVLFCTSRLRRRAAGFRRGPRDTQFLGRVAEIVQRGEQPVHVVLERDLALDVTIGEEATRLADRQDLDLLFVHGARLKSNARATGRGPPVQGGRDISRVRSAALASSAPQPWRSRHTGA